MTDFPLILPTVERALMLYGCAYGGANDCRHVRVADVPDVTVVDTDPEAIKAMAKNYPPHWKFVHADAMVYADGCGDGLYDLVCADPWGGNEMARVHRAIGRLLLVPRDMLIIGAETAAPIPVLAERVVRNENYCWWVWRK